MKKKEEFPRQSDHSIPLAEQLRQVRNALRAAESFVEHELAVRNLDRIVKWVERSDGREGA